MRSVREIAINGMGIALFVVLSMCLRVPVFENYYLCLGYVVMAVYCYSMGAVSGTLVGTVGTILYCILINGLRGMPGWALGNITIGIIISYTFNVAKRIIWSSFLSVVVSVLGIVVATTIGIVVVKSGVEYLLYAQPFTVRVISNLPAYIADVFMLIVSLPVCRVLDSVFFRKNNIVKECNTLVECPKRMKEFEERYGVSSKDVASGKYNEDMFEGNDVYLWDAYIRTYEKSGGNV